MHSSAATLVPQPNFTPGLLRLYALHTSAARSFRYSVWGLFSLVAVVAVACGWITWPQRTADIFVANHFFADYEMVNPFQPGTVAAANFDQKTRSEPENYQLIPHRRSVVDLLLGRQGFDYGYEEFTVCRGVIVDGPKQFFQSVVRYYR